MAGNMGIVVEKIMACCVYGYLALPQVLSTGNKRMDCGVNNEGEKFWVVGFNEHQIFFFCCLGELDE